MLRIRTMAAGLIATTALAGAASAADIYAPPPPAPSASYSPTSAFSWTGAYIGAMGGYEWGKASGGGESWNADGWTGGAYAGYNWQVDPNFVLGLEADISASGSDGTGMSGTNVKNNWNGTVRARAGVAFDRILVYGTGGFAGGGLKVNDGTISESKGVSGWTVGGGVEAAITNNVTTRLEYRYTDLGTHNVAPAPGSINFKSNEVLAGVGLKF